MLLRTPGHAAAGGPSLGSCYGAALPAVVEEAAAGREEAQGQEQAQAAVLRAEERLCSVRATAYAAAVVRGASQDMACHAAAAAVAEAAGKAVGEAGTHAATTQALAPAAPARAAAASKPPHRCTERALALLRDGREAVDEPVTPRARGASAVVAAAGRLAWAGFATAASPCSYASFSCGGTNSPSLEPARRHSITGKTG